MLSEVSVEMKMISAKRKVDCKTPTTTADAGKSDVSFEGSTDFLKIVLKFDFSSLSRDPLMSSTSFVKASSLESPLGRADKFELEEQVEELE